ncbi:MAG: squalene/phytoene synthase family protein [Bacteroidetes bacterium]|nr:squalene/phytoene synthase family protein [Bacteroidota bacterium]
MTPFPPSDWPREGLQQAAGVLWDWHRAAQINVFPMALREKAYTVCERFNLPSHLVDVQLLEQGFPAIETTEDLFDYVDATAGSHALLLAKLAGYTSNWIEIPVKQFARAIFLTRSICLLKEDIEVGRCFIPTDILAKGNVTTMDLIQGTPTPVIRSILWKQVVRARDAYASCKTLNSDLKGWSRRRFRVYWTGGLHILGYIESRKFDVWSRSIKLTFIRRMQIYWQIYFGKAGQ